MSLLTLLRRRSIRSFLRGALSYIFGRRGERRVRGWRLYYRIRTEVLLHARKSIPGLTHPAEVKLWVDREAIARIQRLLRRARHTIFIQMFIWKDDETGRSIAALLLRVAERGVKVYINKETVGDVFEFHRDFLTTRTGGGPLWERFWAHPNIRITHSTFNDHAKVYIIDDRILLLTGMNIADEYNGPWHDYLVELRGSRYVEHYLTHGDVPVPRGQVQLIMNTETRKGIRPAMMDLLGSARHSIVVEHCYLSDALVLSTLIRRTYEGIDVTVILPARPDVHRYSNMQAVAHLIAEAAARKIHIFIYPRMLHGKIILVDRKRAFLGSANLMRNSLDEMGEVNVLLEGRNHPAIVKLRDVLRGDILQSTPLTSPPRFAWIGRCLAWSRL